MVDEPRRPGRPRRQVETPPESVSDAPPPVSAPPGPIQLEIRVDGKIKFLQRVHSYTIDQQPHQAVITGALHPTKNESP